MIVKIKDKEFSFDGYVQPLQSIQQLAEKAYQQGRADALEPIKAIIEESEKMMWHSSKTLENIKEKLKEQKNELV